jgi:hypothetical protein
MRSAFRVTSWLSAALAGGACLFIPACKMLPGFSADAGSDAAPAASSSGPADAGVTAAPSSSAIAAAADAATEPPAHAPAVHPAGPAAAGNACAPKEAKEGTACAPGGFEELTCAGGVWKVSETCRGPGGCKADASGVHCDPGTARAGDACLETAAPHCSNVHTVFICKNGAWETSLCVPPSKCVPNAKNGVAGCK